MIPIKLEKVIVLQINQKKKIIINGNFMEIKEFDKLIKKII